MPGSGLATMPASTHLLHRVGRRLKDQAFISMPASAHFLYRVRDRVRKAVDGGFDFLPYTRGVIHVGANAGQERRLYAAYDLDVLWIEPIPDVFARLIENIQSYSKQKALQYLVADKDDAEFTLHVANNSGVSSSILALSRHAEIWPEITYADSIALKSVSLTSLLKRERVDMSMYDSLVLDTQGSELLVLRGAEEMLQRFKYIQTEAVDFDAYEDCCRMEDIAKFLSGCGFAEVSRKELASKNGVGAYYDIIFKQQA